ncbi:unnamed protein product [Schistosoma curassoni]|uniref:G_PROTEIN_RECEP_F1_2 domain-containing protein n=1 Tax=Schistosoma curassoni TaxID=6186 RepID=A0A183KIH9_9TREM|nr:unnamed protein product [Schistosoma curassoni]
MRAKFNSTDFYTPLDTLLDCMMVEQGHPNASKILCDISIFLGSFMAYIFPLIGVFDLISNCIVAIIFLYYLVQHNRQFVYLGILAISDISILITIGWLRWFPTFGLPFATSGNVYYFISLTSTTSCKLYMFFQSVTCIFRGNIFLIMAFDRLLLIHKPLIFRKHSKYIVWIIISTVFIITILMSLPISINSDLILIINRKLCWHKHNIDLLIIYQALFSYTLKVIRWSRGRLQPTDTQTSKMINNSRTVTMLILHIFAFLCALPCVIAYLLTITLHRQNLQISEEFLRFLLLFLNIGWTLIFLQSSLNIVLYCFRINKFKQILLKPLTTHRN